MPHREPPYGYMAFFDKPEALVDAVRALRKAGYEGIEAYTPFPLEELDEVLPMPANRVAQASLAGGAVGAVGMLAMQYISAVLHYPIRVGGRPLASWPAFIPSALEVALLLAAGAGVLAMFAGNRLPKFYHAVFNIDRFEQASQDMFVVVVRTEQPEDRLRDLLQHLGVTRVEEVPA